MNIVETGAEASVGAKIQISDEQMLQIVGVASAEIYLRLVRGEFNIVGKVVRPYYFGIGYRSKVWNIYTTPWLFNRSWQLLDEEKSVDILDLKKIL